MTSIDKRSLISESIMAIQIGAHPTEEEPDRHVICVTPEVSRTTNVYEVPTKSNLCPCSWDDVLPPNDHSTWPSF
jgi:hypothetical protein